MSDREQIRRDVEAADKPMTDSVDMYLLDEDSAVVFAAFRCVRHCLALLAELEQAERERDEANEHLRSEGRLHRGTETRLAKVPALVEALRNWLEDVDEAQREDLRLDALQYKLGAMFLGYGGGHNHEDDLRAALADWEQT